MALNESQVLAKTRSQDLSSVRKLNCWGSDLTDVSLVRKLTNVEVLCLSCNEVSNLEDFAHCPKLQELILRKNKISSIAELTHLQTLPNLNSLWLGENPVAENNPSYRKQVLRILPNLKLLDNIPVTREELANLDKPDPVTEPPAKSQQQQQQYDNSTGDFQQQPTISSLQYQNDNEVSESWAVDSNNRSMPSLQDQQESQVVQDSSNMSVRTPSNDPESAFANTGFHETFYYSPSAYSQNANKLNTNKSLNASRQSLKMSQTRSLPPQSAQSNCGQCCGQQWPNSMDANNTSFNNNSISLTKNRSIDKLVSAVLLLVEELEFSECLPILDAIHGKLRDKQTE